MEKTKVRPPARALEARQAAAADVDQDSPCRTPRKAGHASVILSHERQSSQHVPAWPEVSHRRTEHSQKCHHSMRNFAGPAALAGTGALRDGSRMDHEVMPAPNGNRVLMLRIRPPPPDLPYPIWSNQLSYPAARQPGTRSRYAFHASVRRRTHRPAANLHLDADYRKNASLRPTAIRSH